MDVREELRFRLFTDRQNPCIDHEDEEGHPQNGWSEQRRSTSLVIPILGFEGRTKKLELFQIANSPMLLSIVRIVLSLQR